MSSQEPQKPIIPSSPDEHLPTVTPPSGAFVLQLFLIPLLIVTIIVSVWLMFSWLAQMGSDPKDLVADLETLNKDSWRKAYTLSNLLRNPENDYLKDDPDLCASLANVLERELTTQTDDPYRVRLRVFLCRALGEFRVDNGLTALLQAAEQREASTWDVRYAAIEAIAVLSQNLGVDRVQVEGSLVDRLVDISRETSGGSSSDDVNELRSTVAFSLGVIGGDTAIERLAQMLDLSYPNARYNAATGMARHGDIRCERVILEMLDPQNKHAIEGEETEATRNHKRGLVLVNGIRAATQLCQQNPTADFSKILPALKRLESGNQVTRIKIDAKEAGIFIRRTQASAATNAD